MSRATMIPQSLTHRSLSLAVALAGVALASAAGCGSSGNPGSTLPADGDGGAASGGGSGGAASGGGSGGGVNFGGAGSADGSAPNACTGLECQQVSCPGGGSTTLTGKVFAPNGVTPLYNAVVYVPNSAVAAFPGGVTCDQCGTTPSGSPVAAAITDATGTFTLTNVPVGKDIPLVIQIGKWRRQVKVATVEQCKTTAVDSALTRLPKNRTEGDIPQIAITTGGADALECFLRKLGIDDSEITNPATGGRVHLYQGLRSGTNSSGASNNGSSIDGSTPDAGQLWNSLDTLKKYDMVILSCEGDENNTTKSVQARKNLAAYLDAGGRAFASHFHYTWLKYYGDEALTTSGVVNGPSASSSVNPLAKTASWQPYNSVQISASTTTTVDQSFAKGQAFAEWLVNVGASSAKGAIDMTNLRSNVIAAPAPLSRRWIYDPGSESGTNLTTVTNAVKYYSFNTPITAAPANQCGRGVYTDIHVSAGAGADKSGGTFPANCASNATLSPQEKALLFLLMDLASCVQDDNKPPQPPPTVIR